MIGKTISHYHIIEELGRGGMGVVYKAKDVKLDRCVALKFLPHHLNQSESDKKRFLQEARSAALINHSHVCTIHEIVDEGEPPFIVMEFVEGKTLKQILKEENQLPVDIVIKYTLQIAEALVAAHKQDIIHRDIKTDNVMLNSDNQIKVMDFGLAKLKGSTHLTKSSSTIGTLAYMSPEQIEGKATDARSDIFSLGVVLYELLTGELPFKGDYDSATMYAIINEEPEPVENFRSDISSELAHVLNRSLEKGCDERYQNMNDMLIDLKRLKRDSSSVSRKALNEFKKTGPARKPGKRFNVHPKLIYSGLPALVALLILAFLYYPKSGSQSGQQSNQAPENSIAVMYFENHTDEAALEKILVDMLTTNLARHEDLKVVSSQRLFDILRRMDRLDIKAIDKNVATEIANQAGARTMLLGSIIKIGNDIRIMSQLVNVQNGSIIGSEQVSGKKIEDIFHMVDELTHKITTGFSLSMEGKREISIVDVTTKSFEAYKYYQKGMEYMWRWNFGDATRNFKKAMELDSTFAMAHLYWAHSFGQFLMRNPFIDRSKIYEAVKTAQKYSQNVSEQEKLFISFTVDWYTGKNDDKHLLKLKKYVSLYPEDKNGHSYLSWFLRQNGRIDEAIQALNHAIELDPAHGDYYNFLTYTYIKKQDYPAALSAVKKYLALQPDVWNPYDSMWELYVHWGKYDQAIEICEKAMRINERWTGFQRKIAYVYMLRGEGELARERFKTAMDLWPDRPLMEKYYTTQFGYSYLMEGKMNQALEMFRKANELAEKYGDYEDKARCALEIGKVLLIQDRIREAKKYLNKLEKKGEQWYRPSFNPLSVLSKFYLGIALVNANKLKEARLQLQQMKSIIESGDYEKFYLSYYYLLNASIYVADNNLKSASAELEQLPPLDKHYSSHYHQIDAEMKILAGNQEEAIKKYRFLFNHISSGAIAFGGDMFDYFYICSRTHYHLARIYEQVGNKEEAIKHYKKFVSQFEEADDGIPEVVDAQKRLSQLTKKISS